MKQRFVFFLFVIGCVNLSLSQEEVFSFDAYKATVLKNHPLLAKAENLKRLGDAERLKASGGFDPSIASNIGQKSFDGKEYYWTSNTSIKIPTWIGANLKSGYEANRGYYLNNDMTVPSAGLWYAGIEIPLGQGLLYDERRLQLQQAKNLQSLGLIEQQLQINDVLLDAYASYWSWVEAYKKLRIAKEGYELASQRFLAVKEQTLAGESSAIDTVEALILLENRTVEQNQAQTLYANTKLMVQTFLWNDNLIPVDIPAKVIPQLDVVQTISPLDITKEIDSLPSIQQANYKVEQLALELRWKKEVLKPTINLNYNVLTKPVGDNQLSPISMQNYKVGITGYVPLFLRKERGGVRLTKAKMENASYDLADKKREYQWKVSSMSNDIQLLSTNLTTQQRLVDHAKKLRDAELTRFYAGESSLFLINTREQSYLSAENKLVELEIKYAISLLKMKWLLNKM